MRRTCALLMMLALSTVGTAGAADRHEPVPAADVWRAAARSGAPVDIRVGDRDVRLNVHPAGTFAGADVRGLDGGRVDVGHVLPLEATITGDPEGWARITVAGDLVTGMIHPSRGEEITLAPRRDGSTAVLSHSDVARLIRNAGESSVIEPGDEPELAQTCDSLGWTPEVASPLELVNGTPLRTFDVAFAVDETFVTQHPTNWAALVLSFVNTIDGLYRRSFDLTVHVVHVVSIPNSVVPATTTDGLLVQLRDYYVATYPNLVRENVHLFTGKALSNAAGQVNCVGSAGRTNVSYSVGTTTSGCPCQFGPLILLPDVATKVGAHEMAHTLSDHHHYANCVEAAPNFNPINTTDACTVMINDWGLINMTFSTVDRLTVRGWLAKYNI